MRLPLRAVLFPGGVALLLSLGTAPQAQARAGSESNVVLAHEVVALGGRSLGLDGAPTAVTAGQVATGPTATSENYALHAGVAWTVPEIPGDAPLVFGVREGTGDPAGGESVEVFGYNFLAPGAGPLDVSFGTNPGTGTVVLSNTRATTTTPGEVTPHGNPPPEVTVSVTNLHGADLAKQNAFTPSFVYEPALLLTDAPRVGRRLHMHVIADPGDSLILVLGQTIPGVSLPFAPLVGAIEVLVNQQFAVPFQVMPVGQYRHVIDVPADPFLIGAQLSYQAVALENLALLQGAFTNPVTLVVQP